jgi:hypothetical protein
VFELQRFVLIPWWSWLVVPRSCVYDLWEAFNDIAEGFGLTIEEFQEIVKSSLMEYLGITEKMLNVDTDIVFRTFDDDEVACIRSYFGGYPCYMGFLLLE